MKFFEHSPEKACASQMNQKRFAVGWYKYQEYELLQFPEEDRYNTIIRFGDTDATLDCTYEEAEARLQSIIANNNEVHLKLLTPLGAAGLFVCKYVETGLQHPKRELVRCDKSS